LRGEIAEPEALEVNLETSVPYRGWSHMSRWRQQILPPDLRTQPVASPAAPRTRPPMIPILVLWFLLRL